MFPNPARNAQVGLGAFDSNGLTCHVVRSTSGVKYSVRGPRPWCEPTVTLNFEPDPSMADHIELRLSGAE